MAFYYEPEKGPSAPSELAHKANALASDATVAQQSREALEQQISEALKHPALQTIREADQGARLLLYWFLGLVAFPGVVVWEAIVSREIYEVILPYPSLWWVPIVACMGIGLWASAALGEAVSDFAMLTLSADPVAESAKSIASARRHLYDVHHNKPAGAFAFHPATGAFLAIIFLALIYGVSSYRVELLKEAGEDSGGVLQLYLPVILYAVEIGLGMPAFFVLVCLQKRAQLQRSRTAFAEAKRHELTLRQAAIEQYTQYLDDYASYNAWTDQKQQPRALLVLPNAELRQLLPPEWGYDPTRGTARPDAANGGHPSSSSVNGNGGPGVPGDGASSTAEAAKEEEVPSPEPRIQQTANDGSREAELLRLLDEQITSQNGRF
jgi:hypothetical protein